METTVTPSPTRRALSTKHAAQYLDLSDSFLRKARMKNSNTVGPKYRKMGSKILYTIEDLNEFLDQLPTQVA